MNARHRVGCIRLGWGSLFRLSILIFLTALFVYLVLHPLSKSAGNPLDRGGPSKGPVYAKLTIIDLNS